MIPKLHLPLHEESFIRYPSS